MYKSQWEQDKILNDMIFKHKKDGFYVDIGAHDGVTGSNSYFFDKVLDWKGICVEPNPNVFPDLLKNRPNSTCLNCCISDRDGLDYFTKIDGYAEMLSGLYSTYPEEHKARIEKEVKVMGGNVKKIPICTNSFNTIMDFLNVSHIDLLSVDTEGSEYHILKGIDFTRYNIDVICVENNYPQYFSNIHNLLINNGFKHFKKIKGDEVYTSLSSHFEI